MMCASKTQISSKQLQRHLEIKSYKNALFMTHRIRLALMEAAPEKLRGIVEVDETYIGGKTRGKGRGYKQNKTPVISAVEREGKARSRVIDDVSGKVVRNLLDTNVDRSANLNTDEARAYKKPGKEYASHDVVNHSAKEYSRKDEKTGRTATTNTAEGYFGNTKRAISGTHHSISPQHTDLYMSEFDYKYNTRKMSDGERTERGIPRIEGKRMTREQMFNRKKAKAVKKALSADDNLSMSSDEFDSIMRKILSGDKTIAQGDKVRIVKKGR